jgi:hypothetical protein
LGGSETLARIKTLVLAGDVHVSEHGYEELGKDAILIENVVEGIGSAVLVEGYPDRFRGPSVLTLQRDADGRPIHVVWAIPADERRLAVLVTAYRPDPSLWDSDFVRRKTR